MILRVIVLALGCFVFGWPLLAQSETNAGITPRLSVSLSEGPYIVGQPILLEVKILVPTWMPKAPVYPSFEQPGLLLRRPKRATHPVSETISGKTWSGTIRRYQIYPLEPSRFRIPPQSILVTFADNTAQPVQETLPIDEISFQVVLPRAARSLKPPVIVASGFTLEQTWSGETGLDVGKALTRKVIARIDGTTAILIPALIPALFPEPSSNATSDKSSEKPLIQPSVKAYPKDPVINAQDGSDFLSGSRQEEVTYLVQGAGPIALPPIKIEWFNLTKNSIETVRVDGFQGLIIAPPETPTSPTKVMIFIALILTCLLCLWGLFRKTRPRILKVMQAGKSRWRASEYYARRAVHQAISSRDLAELITHYKTWQTHHPEVSKNTFETFDLSLSRLGRLKYGPSRTTRRSDQIEAQEQHSEWSTIALDFKVLSRLIDSQSQRGVDARALPDLNP